MSDRDSWDLLLKRLSDDPDAAWTELIARLRKIARLLVDEEHVDEIVSTVSLKLAGNGLARMRAARSPEGYAFMMIRNASIDLTRRLAREPQHISLTALENKERSAILESPLDPGIQTNEEELERALEELPEADRLLLILRFWEDLSIAQVAERLGLPYSTVAKRMFRLIQRLRLRMGLGG